MRKFLKEFKDFALKGNVMNLAVGVIIGAAFQSVVTSLTNDILSPIIGIFAGKNFDSLHVDIFGATLTYGAFITNVVNFIIMAFVVFMLVKFINKLQVITVGKPEAAPPARKCPYCFTEINKEATRCPACTSVLDE